MKPEMLVAETPEKRMTAELVPERIEWIDIYRGLAIILVVIGHANSPVNGLIYMFHMPAFFIISGYASSLKNPPFRKYVADKVGTLIIPFYGSNIFFSLLLLLLSAAHIYSFFYAQPFSFSLSLKSLLQDFATPDLGGATWFLIVLFWASLSAKIINGWIEKRQLSAPNAWLVSCVMYAYGSHLIRSHIVFPAFFDLTFCAVFFFMSGYFFGKYPVKVTHWMHWILTGVSGVAMIYYWNHWPLVQMNWPGRVFGHPLHNIIASFSGSYLLLRISIGFTHVRPIDRIFVYIGQRAMSILILHFLAFRICFWLLYLMGMAPLEQMRLQVPKASGYLWLLMTVLSLILCLAMDWGIRKFSWSRSLLLGTKLSTTTVISDMKWTGEIGWDKRYLYADLLRIISIVAVVFLHTPLVIVCNYEKMPISWWQIANIYQSAVRFAVPAFIMLSGALLLQDERHFSIDFVLRRRITRILFPLLFFSVVYMLWKQPGLLLEGDFPWKVLKTVMAGPVYYHLWFLYLLLGLYLLTPLLHALIRNSGRSLLLYGLLLWVVCATINPLSERLVGYQLPFAPIELSGYVGYFLLGYFLHHLEIGGNRKRLAQLGMVVLCAIAVTAIGTDALSSRDHHLNETFYGYLTANVLVAAAGIFVLVRNFNYGFIEKRVWLKKTIRILSDASFGVYLIHILVLEILSNSFGIHSSMVAPVLAIPATAAVACAVSFMISYGLNQLPFHRFLV